MCTSDSPSFTVHQKLAPHTCRSRRTSWPPKRKNSSSTSVVFSLTDRRVTRAPRPSFPVRTSLLMRLPLSLRLQTRCHHRWKRLWTLTGSRCCNASLAVLRWPTSLHTTGSRKRIATSSGTSMTSKCLCRHRPGDPARRWARQRRYVHADLFLSSQRVHGARARNAHSLLRAHSGSASQHARLQHQVATRC